MAISNWSVIRESENRVSRRLGFELGAELSVKWTPYSPPAFPKMNNLTSALSKGLPKISFTKTGDILTKGITLPAPISISALSMKVTWTPLQPFPAASIPEVAELQRTISSEVQKVTDMITSVRNIVATMLQTKFRTVPKPEINFLKASWNIPTVVDNIIYNFNTANSIFENVQKALSKSLDTVFQSISSAGSITTAIKNVLANLPDRVKSITDNIAKTINANANTLVTDIANNTNALVKNLTDFLSKEVGRYINDLSKNVGAFLSNLMNAMRDDISTIMNSLTSFITSIGDAVKLDFTAIGDWFINTISGLQKNITDNVMGIGNQISEQAKASIADLQNKLTALKNELVKNLEDKVKFVQEQVDKALNDAKKEMMAIVDSTKEELNKALIQTKSELKQSVNNVIAEVEGIRKEVQANAENVAQIKSQIMATAETIKRQTETISKATDDIIRIRDQLQDLQRQVSIIQQKPSSTPSETPKKSIFPFFGIMNGDSLSEALETMAKTTSEKSKKVYGDFAIS